MHNVYWMYYGYSGDRYGYGERVEKLTKQYVPGSKATLVRHFSWLNQRGFGQGYFNNSGVCYTFMRSTFKSAEEGAAAAAFIKEKFDVTVFDTDAEYKAAIAAKRTAQATMRKRNPY